MHPNSHTTHPTRWQDLTCIGPAKQSTFSIASSASGLALVSHTNRSVSVLNTATMALQHELQSSRTVWTLALHPVDRRLLATGTMGGLVSVFDDFVSISDRRRIGASH